MRVVGFAFLLGSLAILSGCSVFGVATRADLDEVRRTSMEEKKQLNEQNRMLQARVERLGSTLASTERTLAQAESSVRRLEQTASVQRQEMRLEAGNLQNRLLALEEQLNVAGTLSDSLREDLSLTRRAAEAASSEALIVRHSLDGVAEHAQLAHSRSETLLRAWLQMLREERQRLGNRLAMLDASLAQWESEAVEIVPLSQPPLEVQEIVDDSVAQSEGSIR